jgi:hypothetical protein
MFSIKEIDILLEKARKINRTCPVCKGQGSIRFFDSLSILTHFNGDLLEDGSWECNPCQGTGLWQVT